MSTMPQPPFFAGNTEAESDSGGKGNDGDPVHMTGVGKRSKGRKGRKGRRAKRGKGRY